MALRPYQNSVLLDDGSEYKEKKLRGGVNAGRLGNKIEVGRDFNQSTISGLNDAIE